MRACKNNEVAKKAGGTKGGGEKVGVAKRGVAITFKKNLGVAKMGVAITFLDFWGWRKKSWRKKNQWVGGDSSSLQAGQSIKRVLYFFIF